MTEEDCGTSNGSLMRAIVEGGEVIESLRDRILGRTAAEDVLHPENRAVLVQAGVMFDEDIIDGLEIGGRGRSEGAYGADLRNALRAVRPSATAATWAVAA